MAISVYDFEDYRRFLDRWLRAKKARSVRALAARIGCSPSYVTMVRKGDRSLKVEHARQWGEAFRLDPYELDYWEALVRRESAPNEDERERAARQVAAVKAWRLALEREVVLQMWSEWYIHAILELARCQGFRLDPEWVARTMRPQITTEQAQEAIAILQEVGVLVEREDGSVEVLQLSTSTGKDVPAGALSNASFRSHRAWLTNAVPALQLPATERYFGSLNVAIDSSRLDEITEIVSRVLIEAAEAANDHVPDRVVQIGAVVVPRSERLQKSD